MSTTTDAPLLRDLIDIPEQVSSGDLVTELASAVTDAQRTVDDYVVTEQLKRAFDQALGLVALSATDGDSRAAFLHGSFGSGKSHFMAMLHLLLQREQHARAKVELQEVVHRHDAALAGTNWLLVPYHMLGAASLEQGVLGGYAAHIRALHPEAPEPPVFRDQMLFANARELRARMGDEAFFDALGGDAGGGGFGRFGSTAWTATSFEAAVTGTPGSPDRLRLQSALLGGLLSSVRSAGGGDADQYVSIDDGLAVMTDHAKALGYTGIVLFLDELILWLASHLSNEAFVSEQASMVPKLRESGGAPRSLPIVSFVARQRDLREFVGRDTPGAQQAAFADTLDYGEGRFDTIPLDDQNLPEIARQRVLRPRSADAEAQIDAAFRFVEIRTSGERSALLGSTGTTEQFRATYPFSPALMQVLVAFSSALQRNRTALKVLKQLLSRRREELRLGDLVGVGEIWDVVMDSPEPFSAAMAAQADQARRLYREKLRPMLLEEQGLKESEAASLGWNHAFRANDRMIKTLLIAALVPQAEAVRGLTVSRLAGLNSGSVRTRIAGNETAQLHGRLQTWRSRVGEIQVSDDPHDPTVGVSLSGVDVESVLQQAKVADNEGARRRKVRELLFLLLEVEEGRFDNQYMLSCTWRGTDRVADLRFGNVRNPQDVTDGALVPSTDGWCLVLDYPFDDEGHTTSDDLARLERWEQDHPDGARTIVWIPSFFSSSLQNELGRLVVHDQALTGDGFRRYADHLSATEQESARRTLETQRDALTNRVRIAIRQAYGLERPTVEHVDLSLLPDGGEAGHVRILFPGYDVLRPVGAGLRDAAAHLLQQALDQELPAHPAFGREPRPRDAQKVLELVREASQQEGGRLAVPDRTNRVLLADIAVPMGFGDVGETAFVLGERWTTWWQQKLGVDPRPSVTLIHEWLEASDLQGVPPAARDLATIAVPELGGYRFELHGGPLRAEIGRLDVSAVAVRIVTVTEEVWEAAVRRAQELLGLTPVETYTPQATAALGESIRARMLELSSPVRALPEQLATRGADPGTARSMTAEALRDFVVAVLEAPDDVSRLEVFAQRPLEPTATVTGVALTHAPDVLRVLERPDWTTVGQLRALAGGDDEEAAALLQPLDEALSNDEHVMPLEPRFSATVRTGKVLVERRLREATGPKAPSSTGSTSIGTTGGTEKVTGAKAAHAAIDRLTQDHREIEFTIDWRLLP